MLLMVVEQIVLEFNDKCLQYTVGVRVQSIWQKCAQITSVLPILNLNSFKTFNIEKKSVIFKGEWKGKSYFGIIGDAVLTILKYFLMIIIMWNMKINHADFC